MSPPLDSQNPKDRSQVTSGKADAAFADVAREYNTPGTEPKRASDLHTLNTQLQTSGLLPGLTVDNLSSTKPGDAKATQNVTLHTNDAKSGGTIVGQPTYDPNSHTLKFDRTPVLPGTKSGANENVTIDMLTGRETVTAAGQNNTLRTTTREYVGASDPTTLVQGLVDGKLMVLQREVTNKSGETTTTGFQYDANNHLNSYTTDGKVTQLQAGKFSIPEGASNLEIKNGLPSYTKNGVTVDLGSDAKPTAYHSKGFSFEYHKNDDDPGTWYYHQDSGGAYVKVDVPTLNDDGSVSTIESGRILFSRGRAHELSASGQTTEDMKTYLKHNRIVENVWHGMPGKVVGEFLRGVPKIIDDFKDGTSSNFADQLKNAGSDVVHMINSADDDITTFEKGKEAISTWDWGQRLEADLSTKGAGSEQFKKDLGELNQLWDGTSYGGTSRGDLGRYYDDNAWVGIAMMDAYKQDPKPEYLDRAKKIFDYLKSGSQEPENMQPPGGVLWQQGKDYRGAVSTGGAIQLALDLAEQAKAKGDDKAKDDYVAYARKQYKWLDENLKSPQNGLIYDGIQPDGTFKGDDKNQFTYNTGLMLGNATKLYQLTGEQPFLDQAKEFAEKSMDHYFNTVKGWRFADQEPHFNAVYFKNLMALDATEPNNSYRQALSRYSAQLKDRLRSGDVDKWHDRWLVDASAEQVFALADQYPPEN